MSSLKNVCTNLRITLAFTLVSILAIIFLHHNTGGYALGATYKISGYINPDVLTTDDNIKSGISILIEGTSYSTLTDKSGYFEIVNIPETKNPSTLKISKASYLIRTIPNIIITRNIQIGSKSSPIMIWAGDFQINGGQDNAINMADVIEFAKRFNSVVGDNRYSYDIDINKDNSINMADVLIIARNFNKTDSSYPLVEILTPSTSPTPTHLVSGAPYKIFIMSGQSNMVGIGNNYYLPSEQSAPVENVKIYTYGTVENSLASIWSTLKPGFGGASGCFGPELTFGRNMAKLLPNNKVLIVKIAWSATSLCSDWRPPSAGGTTGKLWTELVSNTKKAIAALDPDIQYEIAGMCWMQGESDACAPMIAEEYESNLTAFIGDVRKEFNVADMPFVIAMIDDSSTWPYYSIVRKAEQNVALKVPHVGIFDTKDMDTDGSHYKNQGLLDMGSSFASTMYEQLTSIRN